MSQQSLSKTLVAALAIGVILVILLLLVPAPNPSAPTDTPSAQDQISGAVRNFCTQEYRARLLYRSIPSLRELGIGRP